MNKIRSIALLLCVLIFMLCISSCKVNSGYFFKKIVIDQTFGRIDLGKVLLELDTKVCYIRIRENRTTYCPKSYNQINPLFDTVKFKNTRLDELLVDLFNEKDKSISRFVNLKYNPKIDLIFICKVNLDKKNSMDTLFFYLKKTFDFDIEKEKVSYRFHIIDSIKFNKLVSNKKGDGTIACYKSIMNLVNQDMNTITSFINYKYAVFIEPDRGNTNRYSMVLPADNMDSLKSSLLNNCGLELSGSPADDSYVKVEFKR